MKYKCINCGSTFQTESSINNSCPVCGSNNVAIKPASTTPYLVLLIVFCSIIAVCAVIMFRLSKPSKSDDSTNTSISVEQPVEGKKEFAVPEETNHAMLAILDFKLKRAPKYDQQTKRWSFAVDAKINRMDVDDKIVFSATDAYGNNLISTTGEFKNMAVAGQKITVMAILEKNDSIREFLDVDGFVAPAIPQEAVARVTKEEVQQWINDLDNPVNPLLDTKGNIKVSPKCRYTIVGLKDEDKDLAHPRPDKIHEQITYEDWEKLTVESITCDPTNGMLVAVTARVHYK